MSKKREVYPGIEISEDDYPFLEELEEKILHILEKKNKVLIAVVGNPGCGKSTFGKFVRKFGFKSIKASEIVVIDDDVMSREHLFNLFRTKIKIDSSKPDELKPFFQYISDRKKIIFYINSKPYKRISKADIILELELDENSRKERLKKRVTDKNKFNFLINSSSEIKNLKFEYKINGCVK